jgi:hypothetical protein
MGLWMSRLMSYFGEKEARILVLGLDNAGKTTILCELPKQRLCRSAGVDDSSMCTTSSLPHCLCPCFCQSLQTVCKLERWSPLFQVSQGSSIRGCSYFHVISRMLHIFCSCHVACTCIVADGSLTSAADSRPAQQLHRQAARQVVL